MTHLRVAHLRVAALQQLQLGFQQVQVRPLAFRLRLGSRQLRQQRGALRLRYVINANRILTDKRCKK